MPAKQVTRRRSTSRVPVAKKTISSRRPKPKVELFMRKINQEHIRNVGQAAGCDFYASWKKSCCILDFSLVKPGDLVSNPIRGMFIRKEPGGGMIWNPRSGAVYKVNEDAYHVILDVENGLSETEIAKRNGMTLRAAQYFMKQLRKIA